MVMEGWKEGGKVKDGLMEGRTVKKERREG